MNAVKQEKFLGLSIFGFLILMTLFSISRARNFQAGQSKSSFPMPLAEAWNIFSARSRDLAKQFNVPINIVNRAGGGGVVGSSFVANSKADGYTLLGQELLSFSCLRSLVRRPYHSMS